MTTTTAPVTTKYEVTAALVQVKVGATVLHLDRGAVLPVGVEDQAIAHLLQFRMIAPMSGRRS